MRKEFRLPDPGEGLTDADLVTWLVAPGDTVEVNQTIVEIETAKSLVELPSPWAGVVTAILVEPGTTTEVGTPIIEIDTDPAGEHDDRPSPQSSSARPRPHTGPGHASAEPGYAPIMAALGQKPLLDLGLRLGEGTGAVLALFLMRSACNIYNDMATFTSAGVSEG